MPIFEIKHYELHMGTTEVEAATEAHAIKQYLEGDGNPGMGSEYVGPCEEKGLSLADNQELVDQLASLDQSFDGLVVPSIHLIRKIAD